MCLSVADVSKRQACDPLIHQGRDGRRPYRVRCSSVAAPGCCPQWRAATVTSSPCASRPTPTTSWCSAGQNTSRRYSPPTPPTCTPAKATRSSARSWVSTPSFSSTKKSTRAPAAAYAGVQRRIAPRLPRPRRRNRASRGRPVGPYTEVIALDRMNALTLEVIMRSSSASPTNTPATARAPVAPDRRYQPNCVVGLGGSRIVQFWSVETVQGQPIRDRRLALCRDCPTPTGDRSG